jgi:hypothetical protein
MMLAGGDLPGEISADVTARSDSSSLLLRQKMYDPEKCARAIAVKVMDGDAAGAVAAVAAVAASCAESGVAVGSLEDYTDSTALHCLLYETIQDPVRQDQLDALSAAVGELLLCGASPIHENRRGWTPLGLAAHVPVFEQLVEAARTQHGLSAAECVGLPCGDTLLMFQVRQNNVREYVNLRDPLGRTALHLHPSIERAALLLELGADVNATDMSDDAYWKKVDGRDPFVPKRPDGGVEDPEVLLATARENRRNMPSEVGLQLRQWRNNVALWWTDSGHRGQPGNRTPLAYALAQGTPDGDATKMVRLLLDAGASPDAVDDQGLTPVQFGIKYGIAIYQNICDALWWRRRQYKPESNQAVLDDHAGALQLARDAAAAALA